MEKLKTLKDIEYFKTAETSSLLWSIHQEIMKLVKEWDEEIERAAEEQSTEFNRGWVAGAEMVLEDFMDFFNLTEKDLGGKDEN